MTNHNEQVEQSNSEKISNLIHTVSKGKVFKSFRDLCKYFRIEPKCGNSKSIGTHSKKAILTELSRHCTLEKLEKSNKYIITEIFDFPHPKIDEKFLNSKYYPSCGYQLLVTLAEKQNYDEDEDDKVHHLTKKK